jgi:aminopeptidase N
MVLSETLANYSALMMLKHLRQDQLRAALKYMRARYLGWRATGSSEPPLMRVETESWIGYQKGALAMYLIQERMGEDAVNRALRNLLARYKFKGPPYPRSIDLVNVLRAEAKTADEQNLITDLFERVVLYDLKTPEPVAVRRADGKWDVTVPVEARKYSVSSEGKETEVEFAENIEVGLFTADPSDYNSGAKDVIMMERRPIRSGKQVVKFLSDKKPLYAGVDPYDYYIDRNTADNVRPVVDSK